MPTTGPYRQRSDSRRIAFQLLFASDFNTAPVASMVNCGNYCDELGLPCDFSRALFLGTHEHIEEIDALIEAKSIDWQLSRMPLADKAILRLAVFEMLYVDEVPLSVSIDEAVELAKEFGGAERSPAFVNGVLGQIAVELSVVPNVNKAKSKRPHARRSPSPQNVGRTSE